MVLTYYMVSFITSFVFFMILWILGRNKNMPSLIVCSVCVVVNNGGYIAMSAADTVEEAILANKLVYFGGIFLPMFLMLTICQLLRVRVSKLMMIFMAAISLGVMGCTFTVGYSDLYYKNQWLDTSEGFTYLAREYGPLHLLYPILLYGYIIAMIAVIVVSLFRQQRCSYKYATILLMMVIASAAAYVVEKAIHSKIAFTVVVYLVEELIILSVFVRLSTYDVARVVSENLEQSESSGFIMFSRKKQFMGCNTAARQFIPELKGLKIDRAVPMENEYVYDNIILNLRDESRYVYYLKRGNREFKVSVNPAYHDEKKTWIGYLVEIVDDTGQREYIHLLDNYNNELSKSVKEQTAHIRNMQDKLILGMADMVEGRDSSTGGHIKRTSDVIRIFTDRLREGGTSYEFTEEFLADVVRAAPMHDLGKIAIDDVILRKPGKFTDEEFEIMKSHSAKGAEIIAKILDGAESEEFAEIAVNIAHYHHEKWNGKGYPEKLSGESIPIEARIMALADVFDALVSKRCYKDAMSYDKAFDLINRSLGEHFDPVLGEEFLKCRRELECYYDDSLAAEREEKADETK